MFSRHPSCETSSLRAQRTADYREGEPYVKADRHADALSPTPTPKTPRELSPLSLREKGGAPAPGRPAPPLPPPNLPHAHHDAENAPGAVPLEPSRKGGGAPAPGVVPRRPSLHRTSPTHTPTPKTPRELSPLSLREKGVVRQHRGSPRAAPPSTTPPPHTPRRRQKVGFFGG